ncbi:uncharacterized protein LOC143530430 [Bidens hawaiensis]|uniref:uncharacterized protein LOC143530430 n=1 Tax=Bidens hawaiensis TaxID=980011 RepID=UPI00404A840B
MDMGLVCSLLAKAHLDIEYLQEMVVLYSFHSSKDDSWSWRGGASGIFSVQDLRRVMHSKIYDEIYTTPCIWEGWIPIKLHCFVWRLLLNRIPVTVNLLARGLISISRSCSFCSLSDEFSDHVFLDCVGTKQVWRTVSLRCGWDLTALWSIEQLLEEASHSSSHSRKRILKAIIYSSIWSIWKQRNAETLSGRAFNREFVLEEIKTNLYGSIKHISPHKEIIWQHWIVSTLHCILA